MRRSFFLAALFVLAAACSSGSDEGPRTPGYEPLSTAELVRRIEALPGVVGVHVEFRPADACVGGCAAYAGYVEAAAGVPSPVVLLDRVYAILRLGEPRAALDETRLELRPRASDPPGTDRDVRAEDIGDLTLEEDRRARYGPQPGTGEPPENATYVHPRAGLD
jgi:hypothetical protein